jgi:Ca2+-binding RTX toxin-like protein
MGGSGVDTLSWANAAQGVSVNLQQPAPQDTGQGVDQFVSIENMIGSNFNDTFFGNASDNILRGGDGADHLTGQGGSDILDGGLGDDTLDGGSLFADGPIGWDLADYSLATAGVTIDMHYSVQHTVMGDDTFVSIEGMIGSAFDDVLRAGIEMYGGAGNDLLDGAGPSLTHAEGGAGDDIIMGAAGKDELYGDDGADIITGGLGVDLIDGGAGDDVITAGWGDDDLTGGAGADTFKYLTYLDSMYDESIQSYADLIHDFQTGVDKIDLTALNVVSFTIKQEVQGIMLRVQTPEGHLDVRVYGWVTASDLILSGPLGEIGTAGDDTFLGTENVDRMSGGLGDDSYWARNIADGVVEKPGEGFDTVAAYGQYTLPANVEKLVMILGGTGTGNDGANILLGADTTDAVFGTYGDTLWGLAGDDTIDGRGGADTMLGGLGNDSYWVDNLGDWVVEKGGEGFDTVASSVDFTLDLNIEKLNLVGAAVNGTGNAEANILVGNGLANVLTALGGDDTLDGGAGGDRMVGGLGDDAYWIDDFSDLVVEKVAQGFDTVASYISYGLSDNVEKLILLGSAGYGVGSAQTNILVGNALDNTLDGGAGADWMEGGAGADAYWVDNAGDTVIELVGEGFDTIASTVSYTLAANVEKLLLLGSALTATGNSGGNILVGNAMANTLDAGGSGDILDGGTGVDTMIGGTGDDSYWVDDAGDAIVELVGEGFETVASFVSYTLANNVEKLILLGTATAATGSAQTNILVGNALGNTINGLGGDDWLEGGAGVDHFVFGPGAGHDRIVDFGLGGEHDVLDLSAYVTASVTWSVTQQGADTLVAFANGDSVLLADTLQAHVVQNGGELVWT